VTQQRQPIHVGQLQIANDQMVRAAVKEIDGFVPLELTSTA
jgi:hypothetical protein